MVRISSVAAVGSAMFGVSSAAGAGSKEEYASGAVHHRIMEIKMAQWEAEMESGAMDSSQYPELGYTPCVDGFAAAIPGDDNNTFRCRNIDLYHFLSHAELGSPAGHGSSSWGWTSADGREFVAIGQYDGTAFAEITSEGKLSYLGRLPQYDSIGSNWREIRIVNDLVVVGSEAIKHGVQFFDMKKLLDLDPASPKTFTQDELTGHWDELPVGRTHNIVVNQELNYAIACGSVGGNETIRVRDELPCRGGLIFLDISDPTNVTSPGCASADGYVHDAECLVYRGPDERYYGRDICYGYNEDTLTIYDVTNKVGNVSNIISITDFPGAEYIHQGVVNNETWQEYLFMDDEFDERDAKVGPMTKGLPTTHIFDIRDLENPKYTGNYAGRTRSIDHNQYIVGSHLYQSNYGNGLNVLDISSVTRDPSGAGICEAGFFDVYPEDDENEGGGTVAFLGSWSSYANFKSGFIFVHTIERGSFVVKMTSKDCPKEASCSADNCMRAMRASHVPGRLEESVDFCGSYTVRKHYDDSAVPEYAASACGGSGDEVVSRVSSACACIPATEVPELPRTTSRPPVPTRLPDRM
jgi:choice-of-anchor B domain-containing protein